MKWFWCFTTNRGMQWLWRRGLMIIYPCHQDSTIQAFLQWTSMHCYRCTQLLLCQFERKDASALVMKWYPIQIKPWSTSSWCVDFEFHVVEFFDFLDGSSLLIFSNWSILFKWLALYLTLLASLVRCEKLDLLTRSIANNTDKWIPQNQLRSYRHIHVHKCHNFTK